MFKWYFFSEEIVNKYAPNLSGVYLLSETDSEKGIVYVGKSIDIRNRLLQHPDPENSKLQSKNILYFAFEITSDYENREKELIEIYRPECNDKEKGLFWKADYSQYKY